MTIASRHYSTAQLPCERAFDFWVDEVRSHLTPIDITSRDRDAFAGEFVQRRIGPLSFSRIKAAQQDALHEAKASAPVSHRYDLVYMRSGTMAMEQDGCAVTVGANQSLMISHLSDFSFSTSERSDCFLLACPDDWLSSWLPDPSACLMRPVGHESQWLAPIGSLLGSISRAIEEDLPLVDSLVADQVGGCLALLYQGVPLDTTTYRRRFRRELLRSMRSQCGRLDLSPAILAEQQGISVRHLHALFASGGSTFGNELRAIRLQRARSLLRDPRLATLTIGEIALQCGFKDPAHLARLFQDAFGTTPSAWRRGD